MGKLKDYGFEVCAASLVVGSALAFLLSAAIELLLLVLSLGMSPMPSWYYWHYLCFAILTGGGLGISFVLLDVWDVRDSGEKIIAVCHARFEEWFLFSPLFWLGVFGIIIWTLITNFYWWAEIEGLVQPTECPVKPRPGSDVYF